MGEASQIRLLRRAEVQARCGIGSTFLYQLIAAGTFPKPILIGKRGVRWNSIEVDRWINQRIEKHSIHEWTGK
jgi:prophage regulatory protein